MHMLSSSMNMHKHVTQTNTHTHLKIDDNMAQQPVRDMLCEEH